MVGCAEQKPAGPERAASQPSPADVEAARIQADPVAFLREVYKRSDTLEQYRLTFYRQERLGLIPRLGAMEQIRASFRKTPFSVKFEWENPDPDYFESIYVEGQNGNKLIVRERKGILGLPPIVRVINVMDPVTFGRSKNPITDFGLAQVTRRSLVAFDDPTVAKTMTITYQGIVDLPPISRQSHYLKVERPLPLPPGIRYTRQDFYIDVQTGYPSGTDLYTPDGKLDALYRYTNVDRNVDFTDADFRLSKGHPATAPGK